MGGGETLVTPVGSSGTRVEQGADTEGGGLSEEKSKMQEKANSVISVQSALGGNPDLLGVGETKRMIFFLISASRVQPL